MDWFIAIYLLGFVAWPFLIGLFDKDGFYISLAPIWPFGLLFFSIFAGFDALYNLGQRLGDHP